MRIAVLDDYQNAFRLLTNASKLDGHDVKVFDKAANNPTEQALRLQDFNALILTMQRTPIDAELIERLPRLKFISQTGRNTSHLDLAALKRRGVVVSTGEGGSPTATAELTWALILAARRHIPHEAEALRNGVWQTRIGFGLAGTVLGVYAFGRIGSLVARIGQAFGMEILCWGRDASLARAEQAGYHAATSRAAFFGSADVVTIHLPATEQTRGIIAASDLAAMKPDALIVNTSRAALFAPGVLCTALQQGRPGFAAIDVFDQVSVFFKAVLPHFV